MENKIDDILVKIDNAQNDDERIDLLLLLLDTMEDGDVNKMKNIEILTKYSHLLAEPRFIQNLFN